MGIRDRSPDNRVDIQRPDFDEIISITVQTLQLLIEGVKAVAVIRLVHQLATTINSDERAELTASLQTLVETMFIRNS